MKDIIKALNNYIKTEFHVDGQFIDTQTYTVDKNFKGFRHYKVGLYYILRGKTIPIIEDNITVKYSEENKEQSEREFKMKFLEMIFDFVASDEFKIVMYERFDI